jgi:hypothetical protein
LASECGSYATSPHCFGSCTDGSGACASDEECPRHGGIASAFAGANRELSFDLERSGLAGFHGSFRDEYETEILGDIGGRGVAQLERVLAPQCVARDAGANRSLPLGIACREDSDCPFRCTGGDPELDGMSCASDVDCAAFDSTGSQLTAFCRPFSCQFRTLGGASATALDHENVSLQIDVALVADGGGTPGEFDLAAIEILGTDVRGLATSAGQSVALGQLACGSYQVRVSGPNCDPVVQSVDVCSGPIAPIAITCIGAAATPQGVATVSIGGAFTLSGGIVATGPTDLQLLDAVDAPCMPGPGVACIARWELGDGTPVATVLSAGTPPNEIKLLALGGQSAAAGEDPFVGWTDLLRWSPTELRVGLRIFLASLAQ